MRNYIASTGIKGLDDILDGLRLGDNVVWQTDSIDDYRHYVIPFVKKAKEHGKRVIYMRFADHEPLVDTSDGVRVCNLDAKGGFEPFTSRVYSIISCEGRDVFYVFDSLSSLLSVWATDLMIGNFFVIICPYLFELNTIAYFSILRGYHSFKSIARIRETTQLLLEVYSQKGRYYVHPLKVWKRYSPTMFLPHLEENDEYIPILSSVETTQLFSDIPMREEKSARRHLDYWDRLFLMAEDLLKKSSNPEDHREMIEQLCRIMIARDGRIFELAKEFFSLEDLLNIRSRLIGTGFIGGKAVGMLLARKILEKDKLLDWNEYLEHHDSFYVGSDIFYTYIVQNGLWKLRMEQKTKEGYFEAAKPLKEGILRGIFPEETKEQFQQVIEYFGQSPIIIRSSSLLEDAFGNAFAGKYESIFCVNSGSPEERYCNFEDSVRRIYASTMNEDALTYRFQRGLDQMDEQMALLIQRVSGTYRKYYFFPDLAGVGISYNTFVWKEGMDPKAGMLRLVLGLGTRAVHRLENDYARLVALDDPKSNPHAMIDDRRKCSQHYMDVINIKENRIETVSFVDLANEDLNIRLDLFAILDNEATQKMKELGKDKQIWLLTFENLFSRTSFTGILHRMLKKLEEVYNYPVEIEFTANFTSFDGYKINLLQCRPLETKGQSNRIEIPSNIEVNRILFKSEGHFMGGNISKMIKWIIYVAPLKYTMLPLTSKYDVARMIGKINRQIKNKEELPVILIGPGRWGTTTPSVGVPVRFSEINNVTAIGEIACLDGNLLPELSYGTHFFQDLVEADIFYLALFPENPDTFFNEELMNGLKDISSEILEDNESLYNVLKVYDVTALRVKLMADVVSQRLICFIEE